MAGANDILSLIKRRPLTADEIAEETQCSRNSVLTLLNLYRSEGTVGYFTSAGVRFGLRTESLPEERLDSLTLRVTRASDGKIWNELPLGWIASDMLGTNNLYPSIGKVQSRKIEFFMERLLRRDAGPGRKYWMDNLQDYVAEVILSKRNRSALARFVTRDLELDLEELKSAVN